LVEDRWYFTALAFPSEVDIEGRYLAARIRKRGSFVLRSALQIVDADPDVVQSAGDEDQGEAGCKVFMLVTKEFSDEHLMALKSMVSAWVGEGYATPPYSDAEYDLFEWLGIDEEDCGGYDTRRLSRSA
jgi:hypothetical protein